LIEVAGKAAEGRRSPRREAFTGDLRIARSVLECASPLALWKGEIFLRSRRGWRSGRVIANWRRTATAATTASGSDSSGISNCAARFAAGLGVGVQGNACAGEILIYYGHVPAVEHHERLRAAEIFGIGLDRNKGVSPIFIPD
jgi:hypothetical protein